ncbi:hypothetical protein vseg_000629 [Gypsophila vaccaria]
MQLHPHAQLTPHVLIFPLPIQGPVNSMLKLADLLILSTHDIHVTFLTTVHVHGRLVLGGEAATRFDQCPRFSFHTFADGLPTDHPRGGEKFLEMLKAAKSVGELVLREMTASVNSSNVAAVDTMQTLKPSLSSIIADGLFDFAVDVGSESGIPVLYFDTISPCCLWVYMCLPRLIERGEVPIKENQELGALVNVVPSMEGFLRRCDLPDFCRGRNDIDEKSLQDVLSQIKQFKRAQGLILNTFDDLEPNLLTFMRSHFRSKVYTIGPVHSHLQIKMQQNSSMKKTDLQSKYCSNSFWKEDKSCIEWLNKQAPKSVIFCSFGSQVVLTKEQLIEFWEGLVNSGSLFLWVKRPGSVVGMGDDFEEWGEEFDTCLIDRVREKGFIVNWAPQEEVLTHSAVGGFLTHSGWNSTIESITSGVPMICWPHYVDQLVNSRVVSEVWKLGVDMKDTCDRVKIEKMVKDVMVYRKHEFVENASGLAKLARKSIDISGSSYHSLECLIKDIRSFQLATTRAHL